MIGTLRTRFARRLAEDTRHLPVLTGLRGFAALWVYLYHVWGKSGHPQFIVTVQTLQIDFTPLVSLGGAGVTIFFVLSGFLLSLPFAEWQAGVRERPPLGRYLLRRILRVFPAYYFQLAILLAVAVLWAGWQALPDGASLWRHLVMLFVPPPLGVTPFNLVWWTLPIEFGFYLLLPVLSFMLKPGRWLWLLMGSLLAMWLWRHGVIVHLADAPLQMRVYSAYQLAGSFDMFGLGMLAAMIHVHRARLPARVSGFLRHDAAAILGIMILVMAVYWLAGNRQYYWADYAIFYLWTPLLSLGTVLLILSGTGGSTVTATLFANRVVVFAGLISYSMYLWHLPVLEWLDAAQGAGLGAILGDKLSDSLGSFTWRLLLSLPVILVVSTFSYWAVERPAMRLREKTRTEAARKSA
jgi:peptidoglycan/LPS O-acetylase OafA/YrhL